MSENLIGQCLCVPPRQLFTEGNLFPRVVLEDCVIFKRRYSYLRPDRRRRHRTDSPPSDMEDSDRPVTPPRSPTPPPIPQSSQISTLPEPVPQMSMPSRYSRTRSRSPVFSTDRSSPDRSNRTRSRSPVFSTDKSSPDRSNRTRSRSPVFSPDRLSPTRSNRTRSRSPICSPDRLSPTRSNRTRSRSPICSPKRSNRTRSRSPVCSPERSSLTRSNRTRSRSPVFNAERSTPSRSSRTGSRSPRFSPLRSSRTRSCSTRSSSARSSLTGSRSPKSSMLRSSTPPRTARLRLTPVRLARLISSPIKAANAILTPTTSIALTSLPSTSSQLPSSITTVATVKTSPQPSTSTATASKRKRKTASKQTKKTASGQKRKTASSEKKKTGSGQKRKRTKAWDPKTDFEIERIVGYHRNKAEQMWYYVKWKGWSDRYNTYEPIENMTGCNYMLMKFFEYKKPPKSRINAKDNEITESLKTYDVYLKLVENNFKKEDLDEFSEKCVNLSKMFTKGSFIAFSKMIQREYFYIIRCLIGMCTHEDRGLVVRAQNYKIVLQMIKMRRKQLRENLAVQNHINTLETTEVKIENYADLDIFPSTLTYVVDLVPGQNVVVPTDPTVGCECEGGCSSKTHCCGEMASTVFAYNRYRRVRSLERFAIYECNRRCTCPPECTNRVVQHGMKVKLCIFKTDFCGWGVKTLEKIPKGAFICEYVGELISDNEAVVRDIEYYKKNSSYIFDLDFSPDHDTNMYCIDATKYGNLARFINHSCDPNLVVYPVWVDCLEPNLHRLAFFARRPIKKGEELCIDYENAQDGHVPRLSKQDEEKKNQRTLRTLSRIRCRCGATGCREWVFGN